MIVLKFWSKGVSMKSTLLNLWDRFSLWVSVEWNMTTYIIVASVLGVGALLLLLSFLKGNFNKGKKIKWANLILALLMLGALALISYARFNI